MSTPQLTLCLRRGITACGRYSRLEPRSRLELPPNYWQGRDALLPRRFHGGSNVLLGLHQVRTHSRGCQLRICDSGVCVERELCACLVMPFGYTMYIS